MSVNFFRFTDGKLIISNNTCTAHTHTTRYQILPFISKLRRKLRAHQKNAPTDDKKMEQKYVHLMPLPTIQLVEFTVDKRNYKQRQNTFFPIIIDWLKISFKKIILFFSQIKMRPSRPFDCSFLSDEIFNELLAYIFRLVLSLTNTRKKARFAAFFRGSPLIHSKQLSKKTRPQLVRRIAAGVGNAEVHFEKYLFIILKFI